MHELTIDPSKLNGMLVLTESMTIQNATNMREVFLNALNEVNSLFVTHNLITDCDSAYLQILIAANKTALDSKKIFKVIGEQPDVFKKLINAVGCPPLPWIEEKILTNLKKEDIDE